MESFNLESQVAKIALGNFKKTNSYVHIVTEKAAGSEAELFVVLELPLFNPAAESACEQIALAVAGSLRRSYKKQSGPAAFENAIAQMNDELGKLASSGQTNWVDKLNCIIAVKDGSEFSIATCGKTAAYLYRESGFTDISTASGPTHPLKTFENIAFGRVRLNDIVILSTTQLFNYISIDRLKGLLEGYNFLHAAQTVIEILKENAGPEVAFGTLLIMQVPAGQVPEEQMDLEDYDTEKAGPGFLKKLAGYMAGVFALAKQKRAAHTSLPRIAPNSSQEKLWKHKLRGWWQKLHKLSAAAKPAYSLSASGYKKALNVQTFNNFSKTKKILFFAVFAVLILVVVNIVISYQVRKTRTTQTAAGNTLREVGDLLAKADGLLMYKDEAGARTALAQALQKMPKGSQVANDQKESYNALGNKIDELRGKLDHAVSVQAQVLATLGPSEHLIVLPDYFATQYNGAIISYSRKTKAVQDGQLKADQTMTNTAFVTDSASVAFTDKDIFLWNYATGSGSAHFTTNVPNLADAAGFAYYPTGGRVYMADKKAGQVVSFLIEKNKISKPVASVKADMSNSVDVAVDGSIYVLTSSDIRKYTSGKPADFGPVNLFTPLSGKGKIFTQKDFKNLYVLDVGNNRIIVLDKKGNLIQILQSNQFTKLRDFYVDEKNKLFYVLNDNELLEVKIP